LERRGVKMEKKMKEGVKRIGWSKWFEKQLSESTENVARVVAVDRDQLLLLNDEGEFRAKLSGSYMHHHPLAQDYPCVGDWVCLKKGMIQSILERKTSLRRRASGAIDFQMIAANVDYVIIVQSCDFDFNLNRLERYVVMVRDGGAEPYVLLTKTDLVGSDIVDSQYSRVRALGLFVLTLSNVTREGIDELKNILLPRETYCFVGSSGVGKSTIINELIGKDALKTKDVSATGEGRHTTTRRELIVLENGSLVIDNPGMREFGVLGAEDGIEEGFSDITAHTSRCRYRDCTHTVELGCAVLDALGGGKIDQNHYENYLKLRKESEFYQMSYTEKRRRDRNFGKHVKSVKKSIPEGNKKW
jgi:ribosome biogenesis GTPase